MREPRGAITVFLLIIFSALLIFTGLMVDVARIMVAERKVDNALQSAARSVLADCDPVLAGQFGLYGVNPTNKATELERYLRVNLRERHQGLALVDYQIEQAYFEASPRQGLLNDEVFEQQILQYMKYKAPLRLTENVVQKFRQGAFGKKAEAGKIATGAAQQSKKVRKTTKSLNKLIKTGGGAFQGGAQGRLSELNKMQDGLKQLQSDLTVYRQQVAQSTSKIKEAAEVTGQAFSPLNVDSEIRDLEEKTAKLTQSISHNRKLMEEIKLLEDEFASLSGIKGEEARERRLLLSGQIEGLLPQWQVLEEISLPPIEYDGLKGQDLQQKGQLLQQLKKLLGANLASPEIAASLLSPTDFQLANQGDAQDQLADLTFADPEGDLAGMDPDNELAEASGLSLFTLADQFTQGLEQTMKDGGKKLTLCEYIMDKYTFTTTQTKRGHFFELGEVEYILCGNANEIANVGEMFLKIFVIRLAIDSLEDFLKSPIPHPIARLAKALVSGFTKACLEMRKLYEGQSVALCPSVPQPTLAYSDYLRLFLLLQNKNTQLDRMRQLIQVDVRGANKEFALQQQSGSFTVHTEVSVNLLFLPALHLDKLGFKGFTPDRYTIVKEAVVGY